MKKRDEKKWQRARDLARRAAAPKAIGREHCIVPGCSRAPEARAGKGLSLSHCRYHVQFFNRHGSFTLKTLTAKQLRDCRRTAQRWLNAHPKDRSVEHSLRWLDAVLWAAGPNANVVDFRALKPAQKAAATFARLRAREVPALRLLANYLSVTMAVKEGPWPGFGREEWGGEDEYRLTQIGKATLRMASGYRQDYKEYGRFEVYQRSSGLVLRHIGRMVDRACCGVWIARSAELLAFKRQWYGPKERATSATVNTMSATQ